MAYVENNNNFKVSSSSITKTGMVVLGTPQSLETYSKWQESPMNVFRCYQTSEEVYGEVFDVHLTEFVPNFNPSTGCQHPANDYFSDSALFERDYSYDDLFRHSLTSNFVNDFSQTFSESNLQGDQLSVACTALYFHDSGYEFRILVHPNETALLNFCKIKKWNYEIIKPIHNEFG